MFRYITLLLAFGLQARASLITVNFSGNWSLTMGNGTPVAQAGLLTNGAIFSGVASWDSPTAETVAMPLLAFSISGFPTIPSNGSRYVSYFDGEFHNIMDSFTLSTGICYTPPGEAPSPPVYGFGISASTMTGSCHNTYEYMGVNIGVTNYHMGFVTPQVDANISAVPEPSHFWIMISIIVFGFIGEWALRKTKSGKGKP